MILLEFPDPVPYIANCSRWKSFAVAGLNCNSLENIHGCPSFAVTTSIRRKLFHWKSFAVTK